MLHTHCYNKTGGGEGEAKDRIYDEVGEGTDTIGGQKGHYQELNLETMDKKQYETLHGGHQCYIKRRDRAVRRSGSTM